jgi:flagellar biosynthesis/type III secretory pathway protein FliH
MNDEYKTDRGEPEVTLENWLTDTKRTPIIDTNPDWKQGFAAGYAVGFNNGYERGYEDGWDWSPANAVTPNPVNPEKQAQDAQLEATVAKIQQGAVGWTEDDVKRLYEQTTRGKMP